MLAVCCDFGLRHAHIEAVDEDQSIPGMSHLETEKVGWSQRWGTPKFVTSELLVRTHAKYSSSFFGGVLVGGSKLLQTKSGWNMNVKLRRT